MRIIRSTAMPDAAASAGLSDDRAGGPAGPGAEQEVRDAGEHDDRDRQRPERLRR